MSVLAIHSGKPVRSAPLGTAWPVCGDAEVAALTDVVRSGRWGCHLGRRVKDFEAEFAAFCKARHAICLTNGTAALEVVLRALGVGPGDEVIVPPYTFIATASAVVMIGGIPVFVDIEPGSLNLDPAKIEAAITPRTKAIVPVHVGGRPADMDGIMAVAAKHGLRVVEDACQAHGASWRGRSVGTIGDAGAFSFQASKNINAGEGGAIVTNDDELYLACYSLVNVGRIPEGEWYQHENLGSNYRLSEFQGAILHVQMARWEEQAACRERNAAYLDALLGEVPGVQPADHDERVTRNALHLYFLRYCPEHFSGAPKARFLEALSAEGVPASPGYTPLHTSGLFRQFSERLQAAAFFGGRTIDYAGLDLPVTQKACDHEVCWFAQRVLLGTRQDMEDIAAAIMKVQKHCAEL